jgi:hypothetical protein
LSRFRNMQQISRGKFDRLPRTTAGFATSAFDGCGLPFHTALFLSKNPEHYMASLRRATALPLKDSLEYLGAQASLKAPYVPTTQSEHTVCIESCRQFYPGSLYKSYI